MKIDKSIIAELIIPTIPKVRKDVSIHSPKTEDCFSLNLDKAENIYSSKGDALIMTSKTLIATKGTIENLNQIKENNASSAISKIVGISQIITYLLYLPNCLKS